MKLALQIVTLLLLLVSTGCVSLLNHAEGGGIYGSPSDGPYPGVRCFLQDPPSLAEGTGFLWLDFPFTAALDTLLLPIDLTHL